MLRQLFDAAPAPAQPVAAIALGGYGRRQLCLWSDIDLLVLFEGPIGAADERFLHGFLTPLWDLGVVVGQQVRELADFSELEVDNPEFLLALVDARPLAGDRTLFERFTVTFHQPATHAHIVASLVELIDARHARFNDTLYQLEPDVKEAPGALRDLTAARTIAGLTDPTLLTRGPVEAARLEEAEDYLLRIRSMLHLMSGRNQNVLTPRASGEDRRASRIFRRAAAAAGRAADERLFPPRQDGEPFAASGSGSLRRRRSA